jgi:uncharacterized membrane protein YbhN (UPF0104 family)
MSSDAEALHPENAGGFDHPMKPILYAIGTAIFVASLGYLAFRIAGQWQSLKSTRIDRPDWFAASVAIYAISHITTGLAWPNALRLVGDRVSLRDGLKIGLVAQVGKYLPGNVAHYLGRAALGKAVGISFRRSGLSTLVEIACALIAALLLSSGVLIAGKWSQLSVPVLLGVVILATLAAVILFALRRSRRKGELGAPSGFIVAAVCITISLCLSGASAYCLLTSISAPTTTLIYVVGAFALAWITGMLMPGAPGGLGVREAILVTLLSSQVGGVAALACAILHRIVTAAVDAAAAIIGYAWFASGTRSKT